MVAVGAAGDIIMTASQCGDISGGGTMYQTMPIVKVKDLGITLAAFIAQKRRTT
jgi:hypothetical protein